MQNLQGHTDRVRCVAYSPDGTRLASCGDDGVIRLWDPVTGRRRKMLRGHRGTVYEVAFHPDGTWLASAGRDGRVRLWALTPGGRSAALPEQETLVTSVAFRPEGQWLASGVGNSTGRVVLWDVEAREVVWATRVEAGGVWCVAFTPDGHSVALGASWPGEVQLRQIGRTRPFARLERPSRVRALAFSPDGRTLAVASEADLVLWEPVLPTRTGRARPQLPPRATLSGHTGEVHGLAFAADGRTLASASHDGTVRLWDVSSGEERARYDWGIGKVNGVAFSPDGTTIAAGGERDIIIWDADERA